MTPASPRPLQGRRIVVTRAAEQASPLAAGLEALGATAIPLPTIALAPPDDFGPLDRALRRLDAFDGFVFTSANGVRGFFERAAALAIPPRPPDRSWVAAIGPATAAALAASGWPPTVVADGHHAEGLIAALAAQPLTGRTILLPRAAAGRELIVEELGRRGASVIVAATHRTVLAASSQAQAQTLFPTGADAVVFTSSSTARHLAAMLGDDYQVRLRGVALVAIGPVTRQTLEELGLPVGIEAEQATVTALLQALGDYYARTS